MWMIACSIGSHQFYYSVTNLVWLLHCKQNKTRLANAWAHRCLIVTCRHCLAIPPHSYHAEQWNILPKTLRAWFIIVGLIFGYMSMAWQGASVLSVSHIEWLLRIYMLTHVSRLNTNLHYSANPGQQTWIDSGLHTCADPTDYDNTSITHRRIPSRHSAAINTVRFSPRSAWVWKLIEN